MESSLIFRFFCKYSLVGYVIALSLNLFLLIFFKTNIFEIALVSETSGNDAGYYHLFALRERHVGPNAWHHILRFLNDYGLYNRSYIVFINYLNYLFLVPFLISRAIHNMIGEGDIKYIFRLTSIYLFLYPAVFFIAFDIYREIFMLTVFSITVYIFSWLFKEGVTRKQLVFTWISLFLSTYVLFELRTYLGLAFFLSLILFKFHILRYSKGLLIFLSIVFLLLVRELGLIDGLLGYRGNGFTVGSSSLMIGLVDKHYFEFLAYFFISFAGQFLGFYVTNIPSALLIILETIPLSYMMFTVFKKVSLSNSYVRFFMLFFILYTYVWVIGNDNMGTAMRLRIFSSVSIYLLFATIIFRKSVNSVDTNNCHR